MTTTKVRHSDPKAAADGKGKTATRRRFLTGAAGVAAGGAAAVAMPNIATAAPTVLKVQAAWAAASFSRTRKAMSIA